MDPMGGGMGGPPGGNMTQVPVKVRDVSVWEALKDLFKQDQGESKPFSPKKPEPKKSLLR